MSTGLPNRRDRLGHVLLPILYGVIGVTLGLAFSGSLFGAWRQSPPVESFAGMPSDTTVVVLRAQLQTMRDYDQRIIGTVYWGLGTAAAIIIGLTVILIGFNWFANMRLIDRDKVDLERELQADIRDQIEQRQAALKQTLTAATESQIEKVRQEITAHHRAVMDLKNKELRREAREWETDSSPTYQNAIECHREAIDVALALGNRRAVEASLDDIQRLLDKAELPDAAFVGRLNGTLRKLPPEYGSLVEAIRGTLQGRLTADES